MARLPCSVPILTLNVRPHLARLLPLLQETFEDVFIVDGNSTDGTVELAESLGVRVERQSDDTTPNRRITDFTEARLHSWSLARYDWIFLVDADEEPTNALCAAVHDVVTANHLQVACRFRRLVRLPDGTVVTRAFFYPEETMVRLFHRKSGVSLVAGRKVHERFTVPSDVQVVRRPEAFVHTWPAPDVFRTKMAHYATLEYDGWTGKGFLATLRWVVWYNVTSAASQCVRAVWCWFIATLRRETVLPWVYVWPFIAYRFQSLLRGLKQS